MGSKEWIGVLCVLGEVKQLGEHYLSLKNWKIQMCAHTEPAWPRAWHAGSWVFSGDEDVSLQA